tara:strand:- start:737 stop:931 length:195 start_codon:yes stop_codon:yes gene_type:complete
MSKYLIIVESLAKAKTIEKYLGKDYQENIVPQRYPLAMGPSIIICVFITFISVSLENNTCIILN